MSKGKNVNIQDKEQANTPEPDKGSTFDLKEGDENTSQTPLKPEEESESAAELSEEEEIEVEQASEKSAIDVLQTQIEALQREVEAKNEQFLRKVAEFDNLKKRVQRERVQIYENAKADALKAFLPINDDLKRTLEASAKMEVDDKFLEGIQMVAGKFEDALEKYGIVRIDDTGVPFNVDVHEALMRQPAPNDETESNTVLQILEPGYKMGDKVIRHAKVIVSQ
jgi:molecular chaperone GrpE